MTSDSGYTPWLDDGDVRLYHGDALEQLAAMPSESVQCIVTSPPFWGLRDYGTGTWSGGDEGCEHDTGRKNHGHAGNVGTRNADGNAFRNSSRYVEQGDPTPNVCRCGATRVDQQIGLEETPACSGIGTGLMRLRADLTPDQRAFVARRLAEEASRDA